MTSPSLDIAAATWLTRQRNGLDAAGQAELQAWLDADPQHAAAFQAMAGTVRRVQQLPAQDIARLKAGLPRASAPLRPRFRQAGAAALATVAFALIGVGWIGWQHWQRQPTFEQVYATARGQQVKASLPDAEPKGSTIQLDTATQVEARLYRDRRELQLKEGQVMFEVHADAQRPFHVQAGAARITVVGTRFSVRHTASGVDAGQTIVSVEEGRVRVARAEASVPGSTLELTASQQVTVDAQGRLGAVQALSPSDIAPWRSGRVSFDRTPLRQALAEFERYGNTGVVVRDPAVATLPVGGSYSLAQFRRFAETLPQVLPVRLVPRDGVIEVVAR
jgi:transmembrane sensor